MGNIQLSTLPAGEWKLMPAARVTPLERERAPRLARIMLALIRRVEHTSEDYNVFATLARLGRIFPAHTLFLSQLLKSGHIPVRDKELMILRVAWRLGAVYEYGHHLHTARDLGVAEAELDAATTACPAGVSERLAAFLVAADELLADHTLSESTWALLSGHASDDELLELCMLVGHYVMVSIVLNATGIQLEPRFAAALTRRPV